MNEPKKVGVSPNQQACLQQLDALRDAVLRGEVTSVAFVTVGMGGAGSAFAGTDAGGLMLGIELLKGNIMQAISQPRPAPRSPILRPGRIG
jgi:hypothetical protein